MRKKLAMPRSSELRIRCQFSSTVVCRHELQRRTFQRSVDSEERSTRPTQVRWWYDTTDNVSDRNIVRRSRGNPRGETETEQRCAPRTRTRQWSGGFLFAPAVLVSILLPALQEKRQRLHLSSFPCGRWTTDKSLGRPQRTYSYHQPSRHVLRAWHQSGLQCLEWSRPRIAVELAEQRVGLISRTRLRFRSCSRRMVTILAATFAATSMIAAWPTNASSIHYENTGFSGFHNILVADRESDTRSPEPYRSIHETLQQARSCSGCDLSALDLKEIILSGADLHGASLTRTNLFHARLSGANLHAARLEQSNLDEAALDGADLSAADLKQATLRRALLLGAHFDHNISIDGADFTGAILDRTDQRFLCELASGVNNKTGVSTSGSLACSSEEQSHLP